MCLDETKVCQYHLEFQRSIYSRKVCFYKDFTLKRNGHDSLLSYVKALNNPASMNRFIYLFLRGNFCQNIFLKVL